MQVNDNQGLDTSISDVHNAESPILTIRDKPVMMEAVNALTILGKSKKLIIQAKGLDIPNAVAVANIITEKMLKGNSTISKVSVDTEGEAGIGRMLSTIEIILQKD